MNSIEIGDKVTRNQDGLLVNLSQLERKAKPSETSEPDMSDKEMAHKIAWEYTKHYDPTCSKQEWCEMAAIDMANWKDSQK